MSEKKEKYNFDVNALAALTLILGAFVFCFWLHLYTVKWPTEQTKNQEWTRQAQESLDNVQLVCPSPKQGEAIVREKCKRADHYEYDRDQQIIDHKAQVSMRNATWLAVALTFAGLVMIWRTLGYTRQAAGFAESALKQATDATGATWKALEANQHATKAEFQPYITFSPKLELDRLYLSYAPVEEDKIVGADAVVTSTTVNIAPQFSVINKGKTPAQDFDVSFQGKITNTRVVIIEGERDTITEVFQFSGRTFGPDYVGIDDEGPVSILKSPIYDKEIPDAPNISETVLVSFLSAVFVFEFVISFTDEFSDRRRAFIATYSGYIDADWVTLISSRELAETEQEYKNHNEAYKKSLEFPASAT